MNGIDIVQISSMQVHESVKQINFKWISIRADIPYQFIFLRQFFKGENHEGSLNESWSMEYGTEHKKYY